jgi:opacity protein-like surface antigen
MTKGRLVTVLGGMVLVPVAGSAQEALRGAMSADRALAYQAPPSVSGPDRLYWGPVQFSAGASLSVSYDDNIRNLPSEQRLDDVIIRPGLDLGVQWPVTETSALTVGFGVGYAFHVEHSEFDYFQITPTSALSYSVTLRDLVLTVYDQVQYSSDVLDTPDLTGQARYPRLENTVGLRAAYNLQTWLLQGGYAFYRYWAFDDDYQDLERGSHQFFLRPAYRVAEATQAGVEVSYSISDFDLPVRNDFISLSAGPYLDWTIVEGLRVGVRGGYVLYSYSATGTLPSLGDRDSWYAGVDLRHDLTEYLSHTLSVVRDVSVGVNSQYLERLGINYGIRWQFTDIWSLGLGANYAKGEDTTGVSGEDYDRVGFNAGISRNLTERLRADLSYRYYTYTSSDATRQYARNVVSLGASYQF